MMNNILKMKKADPFEIIENGDIVMLSNNKVTRAVIENSKNNDTLTVGICIDDEAVIPNVIDGGNATIQKCKILNGGKSANEGSNKINTGDSIDQNIIDIVTTGKHIVNMANYSNIYDEVTISNIPR